MSSGDKIVLIVDDEPDICWAMEQILGKMGISVLKAENGEQALTLVREANLGLAFIDAKLPGLDGIDLTRMIREIRADLPVFIISGYFYEDDAPVQGAVKDKLICGFIGKPFLLEQVRKAASKAKW